MSIKSIATLFLLLPVKNTGFLFSFKTLSFLFIDLTDELPKIIGIYFLTDSVNFSVGTSYTKFLTISCLVLSKYPTDSEIINISCDTFFQDLNNKKLNTIISKHPELNIQSELVHFCNLVEALRMGKDKILFYLIVYETMKYSLKDFNSNQNIAQLYSDHQFLFMLSKVILIYKPYKSFLNTYYYEVLFHSKLSIHLIYLLSFLMTNIILQISNFILINFGILNPIENILKNVDNIIQIFKYHEKN